jgi:hypothetical protein
MTVVVHNKFENPATGETYTWARNHAPDGEDDAGKARPIERIPNTAGGTAAFQQGEDGLYTTEVEGHPHPARPVAEAVALVPHLQDADDLPDRLRRPEVRGHDLQR